MTWDSEAQLAIDPSIIGSSIEAYLATSERLDKLDEEEPEKMETKITTNCKIKAEQV